MRASAARRPPRPRGADSYASIFFRSSASASLHLPCDWYALASASRLASAAWRLAVGERSVLATTRLCSGSASLWRPCSSSSCASFATAATVSPWSGPSDFCCTSSRRFSSGVASSRLPCSRSEATSDSTASSVSRWSAPRTVCRPRSTWRSTVSAAACFPSSCSSFASRASAASTLAALALEDIRASITRRSNCSASPARCWSHSTPASASALSSVSSWSGPRSA
mmetsp:Transcript_13922/g.40358  ORF Transcript_13922/g.40358 Transcript_13922/m.40358 type:complete len:226 (+) Transcript_13922:2800-3477(+)